MKAKSSHFRLIKTKRIHSQKTHRTRNAKGSSSAWRKMVPAGNSVQEVVKNAPSGDCVAERKRFFPLWFLNSVKDIRLFQAKIHCIVGLLTNVEVQCMTVITQRMGMGERGVYREFLHRLWSDIILIHRRLWLLRNVCCSLWSKYYRNNKTKNYT